jgi:serine/threonine protein kinase
MGVVWLGRDEVLGRPVAIKRVGMFPGSSQADVDRAAREARLAATLSHPNVVAVFDLATDGDQHWLVMEYVEGDNLSRLVRDEGPLPPEQAGDVLGKVADALAAAHAEGIVHRDVKPSNLLVTRDGQVKLTDFGIARGDTEKSLTQTGLITGSPAYIAPEVAGGSSATAASDVWSLGATLYYALAGTPPYEATDNVLGTLFKIVHEDPPRLADAGHLEPVLEATMHKDPAGRWTMAQVRDFLLAGPSAGTEETARMAPVPAALPTQETRETQSEPTAIFGAPAAAAATAADPEPSAAAAPEVSTTPPEEPPATTTEPAGDGGRRRSPLRSGALLPLLLALVLVAVIGWIIWSLWPGDPQGTPTANQTQQASPSKAESPSPKKSPSKPEPSAEEMSAFVEDYLSTVTSDPETTWNQLTPGFQEQSGGFESYSGFWSTIESATPRNVRADPEAMTVSYSVDYVEQGGGTSSDQVTLELVQRGDRYLIAGER